MVTDKEQLIERWTKENEPIGKALGYPNCCIQEFCNQPPELLQQSSPTRADQLRLDASHIKGTFSGFIPCLYHAHLILMGKIRLTDLIQNRDPKLPPFPELDASIGINPDQT